MLTGDWAHKHIVQQHHKTDYLSAVAHGSPQQQKRLTTAYFFHSWSYTFKTGICIHTCCSCFKTRGTCVRTKQTCQHTYQHEHACAFSMHTSIRWAWSSVVVHFFPVCTEVILHYCYIFYKSFSTKSMQVHIHVTIVVVTDNLLCSSGAIIGTKIVYPLYKCYLQGIKKHWN